MDTVIVAAVIDVGDKWHASASALSDAISATATELFLMDVVINEAVGVLTRRMQEQRRLSQFDSVFARLERFARPTRITWISSRTERLYPEILELVRQHRGELNFNDALIALACREMRIPYIASYDRDFDRVPWLTRIDSPANVPQS